MNQALHGVDNSTHAHTKYHPYIDPYLLPAAPDMTHISTCKSHTSGGDAGDRGRATVGDSLRLSLSLCVCERERETEERGCVCEGV